MTFNDVAPTAVLSSAITFATEPLFSDTVSMTFVAPGAEVSVTAPAPEIPDTLISRLSAVAAIAALPKFSVVAALLVLMLTVGTEVRLFNVSAPVVATLDIVVTPEAPAMFSVDPPVEVSVNCSIAVVLTATVDVLSAAVKVSTPAPPSSTSPRLRELLTVASNESCPEPPLKVFTPTVKANDCAA